MVDRHQAAAVLVTLGSARRRLRADEAAVHPVLNGSGPAHYRARQRLTPVTRSDNSANLDTDKVTARLGQPDVPGQ